MKSSLTHTLKQHKNVENKWNIPCRTEDCRVKSSAEREDESSVNLLMLQYLPIHLFQSCLSLGVDGRQHSSPLPWLVSQVMEQGSDCAAASAPLSFFSHLICNPLLSASVTENNQRQTWQCARDYSLSKLTTGNCILIPKLCFLFFRAEEQKLPTGWRVLRTRNTISQHLLLCKMVF